MTRLPTRQWCEANPADAAQILRRTLAELADVGRYADPARLPSIRRRERDLWRRLAEIGGATP